MDALDIIVIGVVLAFTLVSAMWGLIRQVIAVSGLIIGLYLAGQNSLPFASNLGFIDNPVVARGAAFVIIVIGVGLAASLLASVLYFAVGLLFLGWLDALLGAVLGFVQGWLVVGVIMVGASLLFQPWMTDQLNQSVFASKIFGAVSGLALTFAPPELKDSLKLVTDHLK